MSFPSDFLWGAATSAYQIEGALDEGGRGPSIWDHFPCERGETGQPACDHYRRFREDVTLMRALGLQAYRFSIAWPRIFPTGAGALNQPGLDFYNRLVDELLQRGISPVATLYHWDLPEALQDDGGWLNRETAYRFAEYANVIFDRLGDRIPMWITHNEPWCAAMLGHFQGVHAPGVKDLQSGLRAAHHLLLSHGLAVGLFRSKSQSGQIGITLNLSPTYPLGTDDEEAARLSDGYTNRWYLDPLYRSEYPSDIRQHFEKFATMDFVQDGDLETMGRPIDFLGVNYYSRRVIQAGGNELGWTVQEPSPGVPTTEMGWEVVPQCLPDLLTRLEKDYGPRLPMYITENGAAFEDTLTPDGVADPRRVAFLKDHLEACRQALAAGVNLKGYFAWSLLDNFEWACGYRPRFGLVHVDYPTQKRTPKHSALFYRDFIKNAQGKDARNAEFRPSL